MRLGVASSVAAPLFAASIGVLPPTITHCVEGKGRARIEWDSGTRERVQVRVGGIRGTAMSGFEDPGGSTQTGDWVVDGMVFTLVGETGRELARAVAHVRCDGLSKQDNFFPLETGNQWIYRVNSRQATSVYDEWTVLRSQIVNDFTYWVVQMSRSNSQALYRTDEQGRVYRRVGPRETLWLDPTSAPDASATLRVERRVSPYVHPLGTFGEALVYSARTALTSETGVFIRGIGLAGNSSTMLTGSSGGFLQSSELVAARIGGEIRLQSFAPSLQLGVETTDLNVSDKEAPNCAVPCYFAACGLVGGADPPNTYKPCFQARISLDAPTEAARELELELTNVDGKIVHQARLRQAQQESTLFHQVPLYSGPNTPFAPGIYRLTVRCKLWESLPESSSTMAVRVR